MSQNPMQFPPGQGYGPQGYGPPPQNPYGNNNTRKSGMSTTAIVLIVVGVVMTVGLMICGILVGLLLPAVQAAREAARRMNDQNNLKQVGLAFHNYESAYKRLPAPVAVNASGEKVWSWSISLLPFVEENMLYDQVAKHFVDMKPWNSPGGPAPLQGPAPKCLLSSRAKPGQPPTEANIFIISAPAPQQGRNPMFVEGQFVKFSEITDGTSNTIMAIMLKNHSAPWASPTTLSADEAFQLIQNEDRVVLVLMGDGSVRALPTTIDQATFSALVTRDGGEAINIDAIGL